jgi:hypothetical protein
MKDKLIADFANYIQTFKIKRIHLSANDSEVIITGNLLIYRTYIDITLILFAIYGTYNVDDKSFYLIPILLVWAVLIWIIWIDFNTINCIKINLVTKKIRVESRNLFQRLFLKYILRKEKQYSFNEVVSFSVRSEFSSKADIDVYLVEVKLGDGTVLVLTSFAKEEQAHGYARFLTSLIKT